VTSSRRLRLAAAAALVAGSFVACSVGNVDFANKACPCGGGFVCDTSRDLCVLPSDLAREAGPDAGGTDAPAESGDANAGCIGDACPCAADGDCKDHAVPHCAPSKRCVECVAPSDCGAGTYCNAQNECVLGCKQESDCQISPAAPHCDLTRHQCVACRTIADCTGADQCSPSGQCVQGCNLDAGLTCSGGKQCCLGLCIDTTKDLLNCGGCGIACSMQNATPSCMSSACTWACATGYAHCATGNTGCETNVRADPLHCGTCTTNCNTNVLHATGIACNASACDYTACAPNFDDCDGIRANGCECTCGTTKMERCCPGGMCNAPLMCVPVPNKCN
jgi:hypothetical protein